ncbi:MAG: hypothetical protein ACHQPH_01035 [Reyranellales bacterium]
MRANVKSGGERLVGLNRLVGLDVLRGFAAVAVMLHHHGQYYDELYPGRAPLSVTSSPAISASSSSSSSAAS